MPLKHTIAPLFAALISLGSLPAYPQKLPETSRPEPKAPARPSRIIVETLPSAQVYLDDEFKGQASAAGRLVIGNANPGEHALRVSLAGRQEYKEQITVAVGTDSLVKASLPQLEQPPPGPEPTTPAKPSRIIVETLPSAQVYLDDEFKGQASAAGRLVIGNANPGEHALRVSVAGREEYKEQIILAVGKDSLVKASLPEAEQPPSPIRDNTGPPQQTDDLAVDSLITKLLKAWQSGDVETLRKCYASNVLVVSGLWEPPVLGLDNYISAYQRQMERVQDAQVNRSNTFIRVQGMVAWAVYQWAFTGRVDGQTTSFRGHTTLVLEKRDGRWVIMTNHTSIAETPPKQ